MVFRAGRCLPDLGPGFDLPGLIPSWEAEGDQLQLRVPSTKTEQFWRTALVPVKNHGQLHAFPRAKKSLHCWTGETVLCEIVAGAYVARMTFVLGAGHNERPDLSQLFRKAEARRFS